MQDIDNTSPQHKQHLGAPQATYDAVVWHLIYREISDWGWLIPRLDMFSERQLSRLIKAMIRRKARPERVRHVMEFLP